MFSKKQQKDQNYLISISAKPNSIWSNGLDFAELIMFSKKQQKTKTIWFLLNLWKNRNQLKTFFPHLLQNLFCSAKDQNNLISAKPVEKQKLIKNFHSTPFAESILFMQTPISCYSANPVKCQQCLKYSIIPQVLQNEIIGGAANRVNFSRFLQNLWNFS